MEADDHHRRRRRTCLRRFPLPRDALEEVLRRLPPRGLAVSRCVCRDWRDAVDGGSLLRADLLPLKLAAMFLNVYYHSLPELLSRPTASGPVISGKLDFLPHHYRQWSRVLHHCNGLLLLHYCHYCVVNPATRRWAPLPPPPPPTAAANRFYRGRSVFCPVRYLVFDPTVSLHFEVFEFPRVRHRAELDVLYPEHVKLDPAVEGLEWPPSPLALLVFSSERRQWEERSFLREGGAVGTVSDLRLPNWGYQGLYRHDRLYVRCQTCFVVRMSLSSDKYQAIKLPAAPVEASNEDLEDDLDTLHMGSSENGVYYALIDVSSRLLVWILDESNSSDIKWVFKHQSYLNKPVITRLNDNPRIHITGPWALQDVNYFEDYPEEDYAGRLAEQNFEWNSDDDNVIDGDHGTVSECDDDGYFTILGFHPRKEVLFLTYKRENKGFAYHMIDSKVQFLGNLEPKENTRRNDYFPGQDISVEEAYPYTPCWVDELQEAVDQATSL